MTSEPIAIVGVGCTLPGGVHTLDEARTHMDPQQRRLLLPPQSVWHALEHAGQDPRELTGSDTGVFMALMPYDHSTLKAAGGLESVTAYEAMDTDSVSAGQVAHHLGLRGPCITVDTACSGSLTALHSGRGRSGAKDTAAPSPAAPSRAAVGGGAGPNHLAPLGGVAGPNPLAALGGVAGAVVGTASPAESLVALPGQNAQLTEAVGKLLVLMPKPPSSGGAAGATSG